MSGLRLVLIGALVIVGLVGLVLLLTASPPEDPGKAADREWTNAECKACHPGVWAEWEASWHHMAYIDPLYIKLTQNHAQTSCDDCHIPRPIPEVGFGPRTLPRVSDKMTGINCLSCHHDGKRIVGTRDLPSAPCSPRKAPELSTELGCIGCHNQHKLHEEWRKTVFFKQGIDCIDCHMPTVDRSRDGKPFKGKHHAFISSRYRDFSKIPVEVRALGPADPGGKAGVVRVSIKNLRSGHDFPSDSRYKAADLITRFFTPDGTPLGEKKQERFHNPLRNAMDQTKTQIPNGITRSFEYPVPEGAGPAEVKLMYRIMKDDPNVDSHKLFRRVVRW